MEKTLVIIKPDCIEQRKIGEVIRRFEGEGFEICGCKMMHLSDELLEEHYAHLLELPFFPKISAFMGSRPVIIMVLQGDKVVARMREILGPTDSTIAPKGTIRGDIGTGKMTNSAHASDSTASAVSEISRFFDGEEIFDPGG